jgi:hypothetical protein
MSPKHGVLEAIDLGNEVSVLVPGELVPRDRWEVSEI